MRKPLKNLVEYFLRVASVPAFVKYWGKAHLTATEFEVLTVAAPAAVVPAAKKETAPAVKKETAPAAKKEEVVAAVEVEDVSPSGWNLYDFKTLYTNAKDKNVAI